MSRYACLAHVLILVLTMPVCPTQLLQYVLHFIRQISHSIRNSILTFSNIQIYPKFEICHNKNHHKISLLYNLHTTQIVIYPTLAIWTIEVNILKSGSLGCRCCICLCNIWLHHIRSMLPEYAILPHILSVQPHLNLCLLLIAISLNIDFIALV